MELKAGMGVNFPYEQEDAFAFDRILEILHYGVKVYGVNRIFSPQQLRLKSVKAALKIPLYSINTASTTKYFSVQPDSGTRLWPALGLPNHYIGGNDLNFCVHYLFHIGWVYVFYVRHIDRIDYMKPFSIL
jgi:hypothetical protein